MFFLFITGYYAYLFYKLMRKHKLKVHEVEDETSRTCETCGKAFKNLMCLKVHVRKYHTEKTITQCQFCDYKNSEPFYVKVRVLKYYSIYEKLHKNVNFSRFI